MGLAQSVRQRSEGISGPIIGLLLLLVVVEVVHGFRVVGTQWQGGDLLYHGALAKEILQGELPPGGPYPGLPTYYPPGFHLMLAATMAATGFDQVRADELLTLLWLPVLPIGTFLLTRRLTGRPWVAVLAAVITSFGGAYVLTAGRLWVNSLFMAGQEAYPLYPRDVVFALLPFALLAYLTACTTDRISRRSLWAVVAGILFGIAALVQVQLLLPIPPALLVVAGVMAIRHPERWRAIPSVVLITGLVALVIILPWFADQWRDIQLNGGVALDSSDTLEAARFGFWSYPRQFGLILPLAVIGAGVALLFLRRADGPRPDDGPGRWAPSPTEGALVLVAWAAIAFGLAVLYRPDWPLEDALRPQRLWLIASQPITILAAIGLVAAAEYLFGRVWRRPRWIVPAVVGVVVLMAVPSTFATVRLLSATWDRPGFAQLDLTSDHVPAFGDLLGDGARSVVLTYEDWSALSWFETGSKVVALVPPGYAKLAYDPAIFTGHSQAERRLDVGRAFAGDDTVMTAVADKYGATTLILARRDGALGTVDRPASLLVMEPGAVNGAWQPVEGNGWDAAELAAGTTLKTSLPTEPTRLEIRLLDEPGTSATDLRAAIVGGDGERTPLDLQPVPGDRPGWRVLGSTVTAPVGGHLELTATRPVTIQSIRGFVEREPPAGWRIVGETPDAMVLERSP